MEKEITPFNPPIVLYAILDIETTGGKFNEEGITEIAIYKFDGHQIVDQFISLVNPEKPIQPFVVKLTGINDKMLVNAPKFYQVAKRIIEITTDCTLVAHNAAFDYRILKTEFSRLGYTYKRNTICTVQLSKTLIPGKKSYSLGKLVRNLGIPVSDRHRASGDAKATVALFKLLLDKDTQKNIITQNIKAEGKTPLPTKLLDILEELPTQTGVYYIHNIAGEIIYIGKSKNIRHRVNQHFTGVSSKAKKIQKHVYRVSYEKTGSELIALLKESQEIKINQPIYNKAQRKNIFLYGLYQQKNENGYTQLHIQKINNSHTPIASFTSLKEAQNTVYKLTDSYDLCQKLTGIYKTKKACFLYTVKKCKGACITKEPANTYNQRVKDALESLSFINKSMLVIDKGRAIEEKSIILIENGVYKGYGFYQLNHQITNKQVLDAIITPMDHNKDVVQIIQSHLRRKKVQQVIAL